MTCSGLFVQILREEEAHTSWSGAGPEEIDYVQVMSDMVEDFQLGH